jgi:hypothetical protein
MSFGLDAETRDVSIDKAISSAIKSNTIIFAAAANSGGNKPRAYPARRAGVICIHASDGRRNDGGISPTPERKQSNFSTLGIVVESHWKGEKVWKSGTSFSVLSLEWEEGPEDGACVGHLVGHNAVSCFRLGKRRPRSRGP